MIHKQHSRQAPKRFKKGWFVFGLIFFAAVLFYKPLLLLGCKLALFHAIPKKEGRIIAYENMQWEEDAIVISGLQVKDPHSEVTIDRIELELSIIGLQFHPRISILHPQILIFSASEERIPTEGLLYRNRFIQPHWEIRNGVLQLPIGARFYFTMLNGDEKESIGNLVFSSDPDPLIPPMFSATLALIEDNLQLGFKLQESDLSRLLPLTALIIQEVPRKWERAGGEVQLEGLVCLDRNFQLQELHCNGEGKQIALTSSAMGIDLQCEKIKGAFSCPLAESPFFEDKLSASLILKNGNFFIDKQFGIKNLEGSLCLEPEKEPELILNGNFVRQGREISFGCVGKGGLMKGTTFFSEIELKGKQGSLKGEIVFPGPKGDYLADVKMEGDGREIFALLFDREFLAARSIDELDPFPLDFQMIAKINASQLNLEAVGSISGESIKGSALFFISDSSETVFSHIPRFSFKEAQWQAEQLTEKSYGPFIPLLIPGIELTGNLQCDAVFLPSSSQLKLNGTQILIQHSIAQLYLPKTCEKSIQFVYDNMQKQWQGEIPLDEGQLNYKENDLSFENLEGCLKLHANHLTSSSFYAECQGLALRGDMDLFLEGNERGRISLSTSQISGSVQNLLAVLHHFPSLSKVNLPIEGSFSSGNQGFVFNAPMESSNNAEWNFKGHFNALKFPVNESTSITDGHCDFVFDSKNHGLVIEKAEGTWCLIDGSPLTVQVKKCSTQLSETMALDFAFKVIDGKRELAHFEGKAILLPISPFLLGSEAKLDRSASAPNGESIAEGSYGRGERIDIAKPQPLGKTGLMGNRMGKAAQNDLQWEIAFDKQKTYLGGVHLNITRCFLDEQMNLTSFEMCPILKCQDLHIQAAFLQNAGFLPKTFSAKNLQDWQFEGTLQTRLYSEDVDKGFSFHAESRDLKVRGKPWDSFQLKAHKIGDNWLIEHLEGGGLTLKGAFVVDGNEISVQRFDGKWHDIELKGNGNVKTDQKIFSCHFQSIKGALRALPRKDHFLNSSSLKGNFIAEGTVSGDFSDLSDPLQLIGETAVFIDLDPPLELSGKNKKTIHFTYNQANGLVCDQIDLQLKDKLNGVSIAEFRGEKLLWPKNGNLTIEKIGFSLSPKLMERCIDAKILPAVLKDLKWEANLECSGDFQLSPAPIFQASLKPGRYGFGKKEISFEQLQMRYEKDLLTMRGKTHIEEKPLWGTLQVDLSQEPFGVLKLFDHPKAEGLKILFTTLSGKIFWESVQGSCYGVDCTLTKNKGCKIPLATVLSGNVKIDCNTFSSLCPKEIREGLTALKMGKGYGWQGDLILWHETSRGFEANGTILGHEFEFLGYQFHHLQGNLNATPEHIFVSELKIDDPAGMIGIKKFELNKNEKWNLYIPQIFVRHLQPSVMHKIDSEPQVVKPFAIKNFSLNGVRCELGDKSTLEGSGNLTFANQFKKESSLFDVPFEMIKKIGLDPNLLTPVQGELEIELCGDKFYLMSLKNSFSEGQRAEFYLAPGRELSYIDFDGKIHIDLKMHQDVLLKITEPFTLTIRGTLENPRYGLQY